MSLFTDPRWAEALGHLPDYLGNHVRVSVTALVLGLLVSLPLAILSRHRPMARKDGERQADEEAQRQRGNADADMVAEIIGQVAQRFRPAWIGKDTHAVPSRGSRAPSRSACRRGVRKSSPT